MKKLLTATAAAALMAGSAFAEEIPVGVMAAFTGPLESLAPPIGKAAEMALNEVNAAGGVMGKTLKYIQADGTCIDAGAATAAAERLVTADGIVGLVGAMCSGTTGAIVTGVSVPNGIVQISPSATSPGLSTIEDNGLFFRMAPSDARQGVVMSEIVRERGLSEVAITYTNNDYGKGLADAFESAFVEAGGSVTLVAPHDDDKADYSAEIGALASARGEALVVVGYVDSGGSGMIQAALDSGAFDLFVLPDGMIGDRLIENFGSDIDGSFGQNPSANTEDAASFEDMASEAGFDGSSPYAKEGYDSMALMALAMAAANSTDGAAIAAKVMELANAPGEPIGAGELAKALEIVSNGGDIDYVGASAVELIEPGEAGGIYREVVVEGGELKVVGFR